MTTAPSPGRAIDAPAGSAFYALVTGLTTFLSKNVIAVDVEPILGSLGKNVPIELVRADGTVITLTAAELTKHDVPAGHSISLERPYRTRDELGTIVAVHTPGLAVPPLPAEADAPGTARLLAATRAARARGFPAGPSLTKESTNLARHLAEVFPALPDEAIVLTIQAQLRKTTVNWEAISMKLVCETVAVHLGAIGLVEDGDRLRLAVAAGLRGKPVGPGTRALGSLIAMVSLSAQTSTVAATSTAGLAGLALGLELGDAFAVGYKSQLASQGEEIQSALLESGRAVPVGACRRCGRTGALAIHKSWGSREFKCPTDGQTVKDPFLVVPADVDEATNDLQEPPARN